jgi:hypothetical protein
VRLAVVERAATGEPPPEEHFRAAWHVRDNLSRLCVGEERQILVDVRNESPDCWRWGDGHGEIRLSYRWYDALGGQLVAEGHRTELTADVPPGSRALQHMTLIAPEFPGEYVVEFNVVHEDVRWYEGAVRVPAVVLEPVLRTRRQQSAQGDARSLDVIARPIEPVFSEAESKAAFTIAAQPIVARHEAQTAAAVGALQKRYEQPVFGRVRVWDLIERLGSCIDPSDRRLYGASQLLHVLQVLEHMEADGVASDLLLVALVHDLGKVLLLTGEDPANVVGLNAVVGEPQDGVGLESCLLQWNHDEFAFQRLKDLLPPDLAWLVRYHSIDVPRVRHLMDTSDLDRAERLLVPFAQYDHGSKTPFRVPPIALADYRDLVEEAFPDPIPF